MVNGNTSSNQAPATYADCSRKPYTKPKADSKAQSAQRQEHPFPSAGRLAPFRAHTAFGGRAAPAQPLPWPRGGNVAVTMTTLVRLARARYAAHYDRASRGMRRRGAAEEQ